MLGVLTAIGSFLLSPAGVATTTIASAALTAKQYKTTKKAGVQQQKEYDQAAADALLQGRSAAIAYQQQGADILRDLNRVLATSTARASASGINVFSGNPAALAEQSKYDAYIEYGIAKNNAELVMGGAEAQSRLFAEAGRDARKDYSQAALFSAATSALNLFGDLGALKLTPKKTGQAAVVGTGREKT